MQQCSQFSTRRCELDDAFLHPPPKIRLYSCISAYSDFFVFLFYYRFVYICSEGQLREGIFARLVLRQHLAQFR